MMEKRKVKRIAVDGDVSGQMVLASDLNIKDLSQQGIRFRCRERISPQSKVEISIKKKELRVSLAGTVIRSTITNGRLLDGEPAIMFEVAATLDEPSAEQRNSLNSLIRMLEEG